ncbi:SET domain containing protein [Novymonas esmeraldas]|uniref:SET domain containing protein n=1 Tax=Novymonas esmeraldas TaxID=1808958 RepID=A0AAW0ELM6_9TRYP
MDDCVTLAVAAKEAAGRHAVASRPISPGERVLVAAPFSLIMNPSCCPSALYLSAKAAAEATDAAPAGSAATRGGSAKSVARKVSRSAKGGAAAAATAAGGDDSRCAAHHVHALRDEESEGHDHQTGPSPATAAAAAEAAAAAPRWYTTMPARCSVCFQEIPAGRWMCNRGSLAEVAMDVAEEQARLGRDLCRTDVQATDGAEGGGDEEDREADASSEGAAAAAAAFLKLKKPSKSAKTRKDGAVALKQRLLERALEQRQELIARRQLQRRRRAARGLPLVRREGWEASPPSPSCAAEPAMSGCSRCGVLCYCSEACWRAHREVHEGSGECAVLRRLYPRLMDEYYAASAAAAVTAMPGDEPLHWSRSTSEPHVLECQMLLFAALVIMRVCAAGYQTRCAMTVSVADAATGDAAAAAEAAGPPPRSSTTPEPREDDDGAAHRSTDAGPQAQPTEVGSVVLPSEVRTIQLMRATAGLTGVVEVLDADPELQRTARAATGEALVGAESPATAPLPCYAELAQLETNLSVLSKQRLSTYQRYYRTFTKQVLPVLRLLVHERVRGDGGTDVGQPLLQVSASYFQRLCAAAQCNSFGVYDTEDRCIGFGMYPAASYFNHSCTPNLCRVMHRGGRAATFYALRSIAPREPLTICYSDVEEMNSAERRRCLLETYRFFCACPRCSGAAEAPTIVPGAAANGGSAEAAAAVFERPLLLCAACAVRGYLRPLRPSAPLTSPAPDHLSPPITSASPTSSAAVDMVAPRSSWTMQDVQRRECTICRSCVVRAAAPAAASTAA